MYGKSLHMGVAVDVFDGVLFYAVFFADEMSWMRFGTEFSQFLRLFLPTLTTSPKARSHVIFKMQIKVSIDLLGFNF